MKNKEIKKELIKKGTFKEYRKQRFNFFENGEYEKIDKCESYFDENGEQFNELTNQCCQELKEARKKQVKKIREHILFWLNNDYKIFFGTFTYDDKKRKSKDIKPETLKKYVINSIKNICDDYIINIDYGSEKERMHYHTLIAIKLNKLNDSYSYIEVNRNKGNKEKPIWVHGQKLIHDNVLDYEKNVGFYDLEPCNDNEESAKKLSSYIDKLTLHSIKVKQNYVSVKKGTEYQKVNKFKKVVLHTVKNSQDNNDNKKEQNSYVDSSMYLQILKQNKNLIPIDTYAEKEYKILDDMRREKEQIKQRIKNRKKEKEQIKERWNGYEKKANSKPMS